jgi:hypothetical protein
VTPSGTRHRLQPPLREPSAPHPRPTDEQLAGWLIVAVLTHHQTEIEPDKLSWLRGFLRQRLSRTEYRTIAKVMGWSRSRRHVLAVAAPPAPDNPELPDDITPRGWIRLLLASFLALEFVDGREPA